MKDYLNFNDWYPIITGSITIISAIATFVLDRASEADGRRKFLGLYKKDWKRYSAFLTFFFAIVTLLIEDSHKRNEKLESIIAKQKTDSVQDEIFKCTLEAIGTTLQKQNETLNLQREQIESTKVILAKQILTINGQTKSLKKQMRLLQDKARLLKF